MTADKLVSSIPFEAAVVYGLVAAYKLGVFQRALPDLQHRDLDLRMFSRWYRSNLVPMAFRYDISGSSGVVLISI